MLDSQLAPGGPVPLAKIVPIAHLAAALEATKVSQSELARRLGGATSTVNKWMRGKAALSRGRWLEVLGVLGLPYDWEPGKPVIVTKPS